MCDNHQLKRDLIRYIDGLKNLSTNSDTTSAKVVEIIATQLESMLIGGKMTLDDLIKTIADTDEKICDLIELFNRMDIPFPSEEFEFQPEKNRIATPIIEIMKLIQAVNNNIYYLIRLEKI